jgi:PadR family transcriptional regulator, regulatory protein PadR
MESMESHEAGFPPFPHSLEIPSGFPVKKSQLKDNKLPFFPALHQATSELHCLKTLAGYLTEVIVADFGKWRIFLLLTEGRSGYHYSVTERKHMSKPSDLVQGTLDLLVLKILALEPLHGWALSQRLKQVSGDVLQVSDGSLYPALHKLEQQGWIHAEWKPTENNRRAKFYSLTRLGRRYLEKEAANWERISTAISGVLRLTEV